MTESKDRGLHKYRFKNLQHRAWQIAENHGFHSVDRNFGDCCTLIQTEVSEAFEDFRDQGKVDSKSFIERDGKPVGVPSELADIVIRCMDIAQEYEIDLEHEVIQKMEYNESRPFKHGGKAL